MIVIYLKNFFSTFKIKDWIIGLVFSYNLLSYIFNSVFEICLFIFNFIISVEFLSPLVKYLRNLFIYFQFTISVEFLLPLVKYLRNLVI